MYCNGHWPSDLGRRASGMSDLGCRASGFYDLGPATPTFVIGPPQHL